MKFLAFLFCLMIFGGCGKSTNEKAPIKNQPSSQIDVFINETESTLETSAAEEIKVSDNLEDEIVTTPDCTGTLIAPDTALIPSNCLPKEVREKKEKSCDKYLKGVSHTPNGKVKRTCKKIDFDSEEDNVVIEFDS